MSALTLQGARLRWLRRAAAQAGLSGEISEGRRRRPAPCSYSASPQGSGQPSRTLLGTLVSTPQGDTSRPPTLRRGGQCPSLPTVGSVLCPFGSQTIWEMARVQQRQQITVPFSTVAFGSGCEWTDVAVQRAQRREQPRASPEPPRPAHLRLFHAWAHWLFFLISKTIYASYVNISLKGIYGRL